MPEAGSPWDLFCRVVDNWGDAGVCWRLATDIAGRGQPVRLWIDDPAPLAWMAPGGCEGVDIIAWREPLPPLTPGSVVIEAFGCDPPPEFVARMKAMAKPPVWINLEYLSAEAWVERNHGLPSPQMAGPGAGLTKRFFYPGFTPATGGLLKRRAQPPAADRNAFLHRVGAPAAAPGERLVLLFCYDGAPLAALLRALADRPTLLLSTRNLAEDLPAGVRAHRLPRLPQADFDELLGACDIDVVRGEDSFAQAQRAGRPFLWHIYPQSDGAHLVKLEAFLDLLLAGAPLPLAGAVRRLHHAWNAPGAADLALPDLAAWEKWCAGWQSRLEAQTDLTTQLFRFVQQSG